MRSRGSENRGQRRGFREREPSAAGEGAARQTLSLRDEQCANELATCRLASEVQRQRYQPLAEFASDGYLLTDPAGVIQEANGAAAPLLARRQRALAGKSLVRGQGR